MNKIIKSIIVTTLITGGLLQNGFAAKNKASSANKQYICPACPKSFTTNRNLNIHIKVDHLKIKDQICPYPDCPKTFSRASGLKSHIKGVHLKIKDLICPYCDKQFSYKCNLNTHIDGVHNKIKYSCSYCDKQFSQKGNLSRHIKKKHGTMEQDPHQEQNENDSTLNYDKHMAILEILDQQQQELLNMRTNQTIPSKKNQMSDQSEQTTNMLLIENLSADE